MRYFNINSIWLIVLAPCCFVVGPQQLFGQDRAEIVAVLARRESLDNWTARFDVVTATDFDPSLESVAVGRRERLEKSIRERGLNRREEQHVVFRFMDGIVNVETALDARMQDLIGRGNNFAPARDVRVVLPDRVEHLLDERGDGMLTCVIRSEATLPDEWTLDIGLGLRLLGSNTFIEKSDRFDGAQWSTDAGGAVVRMNRPNDEIHEMRYASQYRFALTSYRVVYSRLNASAEIECSDFRDVGGIFVPHKLVRRTTYRDSTGAVRHPFTWTVTVHDFVPHDPENTKENLMIKWPSGFTVLDLRAKAYIPVGPTTRALPDEAIAEEVGKQQRGTQELEQRASERIERNTTTPTPPGVPSR